MPILMLQVPEEMSERLSNCAMEFDCSKSYLIRQAITEYLEDVNDYLEVMHYKASHNPKENISFEKIKLRHGLD